MHMAGAEGEGVVHQGRIHSLLAAFGHVQEVREVAEVPVATPDSVPGAVLVQNKDLARGEPTLEEIGGLKKLHLKSAEMF